MHAGQIGSAVEEAFGLLAVFEGIARERRPRLFWARVQAVHQAGSSNGLTVTVVTAL